MGSAVPVVWPKFTPESPSHIQWGVDPTVTTFSQTQVDLFNFWNKEFWDIVYPGDQKFRPSVDIDELSKWWRKTLESLRYGPDNDLQTLSNFKMDGYV